MSPFKLLSLHKVKVHLNRLFLFFSLCLFIHFTTFSTHWELNIQRKYMWSKLYCELGQSEFIIWNRLPFVYPSTPQSCLLTFLKACNELAQLLSITQIKHFMEFSLIYQTVHYSIDIPNIYKYISKMLNFFGTSHKMYRTYLFAFNIKFVHVPG